MPAALGARLSREAVAKVYASSTGRDLSDFILYRVLAMFKLGVLCLQLHARHRRGVSHDPRLEGFRKIAEGILDMAVEVSKGRCF